MSLLLLLRGRVSFLAAAAIASLLLHAGTVTAQSIAWRASDDFTGYSGLGVKSANGLVFAQTGHSSASSRYESHIFALDVSTGASRWNHSLPNSRSITYDHDQGPAVNGNTVFAVHSTYLYAFDQINGTQLWWTTIPSECQNVLRGLVADEFAVYVPCYKFLAAFTVDEGALRWIYNFSSWGSGPSIPAVGFSSVFIATGSGITRIDARSGSKLWAVTGYPTPNGQLATGCGVVVVTFKNGNMTSGFDMITGASLWNNTETIKPSVGAAVDNCVAYWGDSQAAVFAVSVDTGVQRWNVPLVQSNIVFTAPSVSNGEVWVATDRGIVMALSTESGALLYDKSFRDFVPRAVTAASESFVFIAGSDTVYDTYVTAFSTSRTTTAPPSPEPTPHPIPTMTTAAPSDVTTATPTATSSPSSSLPTTMTSSATTQSPPVTTPAESSTPPPYPTVVVLQCSDSNCETECIKVTSAVGVCEAIEGGSLLRTCTEQGLAVFTYVDKPACVGQPTSTSVFGLNTCNRGETGWFMVQTCPI